MMSILVLHTTNLEMKQPSETKHIRRDSLLWATVFGFWRPETNHRPTRESQPDIQTFTIAMDGAEGPTLTSISDNRPTIHRSCKPLPTFKWLTSDAGKDFRDRARTGRVCGWTSFLTPERADAVGNLALPVHSQSGIKLKFAPVSVALSLFFCRFWGYLDHETRHHAPYFSRGCIVRSLVPLSNFGGLD